MQQLRELFPPGHFKRPCVPSRGAFFPELYSATLFTWSLAEPPAAPAQLRNGRGGVYPYASSISRGWS